MNYSYRPPKTVVVTIDVLRWMTYNNNLEGRQIVPNVLYDYYLKKLWHGRMNIMVYPFICSRVYGKKHECEWYLPCDTRIVIHPITTTSINTSSSLSFSYNKNRCRNKRRPYDFAFFDHQKPFYFPHLKLLEAKGYIDCT